MTENQDKADLSVNELIDFIQLRERKGIKGGIHHHSSVEPTKFKDDYQSHHLDCLARLMTSNEKCVAVCEINGELLVAMALLTK